MGILQKVRSAIFRFIQGRNGSDRLGMFTMLAALVLSLAASWTGSLLLSVPGIVLYVYSLFRMFSKNLSKRAEENRKYTALTSGWRLKSSQFVKRVKNRKVYRYFKCPQCSGLLRMKKGTGEKDVTCARCGHRFRAKA